MSPDSTNTNPPLDASVVQRHAADPHASVWVNASAGTGKTKVLTDRILRLLLAGVRPTRILALTFTKAGAAEMSIRMQQRLGGWMVADDARLDAQLRDLLGADGYPTADLALRSQARSLFAAVLEAPGGLQIQTLHSFCTGLLRRFPVEAGVAPGFRLIEEDAAHTTLNQARDYVLNGRSDDQAVGEALDYLTALLDADRFSKNMNALIEERGRLARELRRAGSVTALQQEIYDLFGLTVGQSEREIRLAACTDPAIDEAGLRQALSDFANNPKAKATEKKHVPAMEAFLAAEPEKRLALLDDYLGVFFIKSGAQKADKSMVTAAFKEHLPIMRAEAERLEAWRERWMGTRIAEASCHFLTVGEAILRRYQQLKQHLGYLDFSDLILISRDLLRSTGKAAWVLYKLDEGLDHLLIDEAQDTNPEQWDIVQTIADEFFSGMGVAEGREGPDGHLIPPRSLFVVGDEKQSIYSFQRASPETFKSMRTTFARQVEEAQRPWRPLQLSHSFRTSPPVLQLVDKVFADDIAAAGVRPDDGAGVQHFSSRAGHAGRIILWQPEPRFEGDEQPESVKDPQPWELPPLSRVDQRSARQRLAERIAGQIREWLDQKTLLEPYNRPIRSGDIMVLVRSRSAFIPALVRALQARNIPVAGADRMVLPEQLAVRDLLALAEFLLLPEDDLTLACVLKSPLIGLDEAQLAELAIGRQGTLWRSLQSHAEAYTPFGAVARYLAHWLGRVDFMSPYQLFAGVLAASCPALPDGTGRRAILGRLGVDAAEPIDEFLDRCLAFERERPGVMQQFLDWLMTGAPEIKRDQESGHDQIRIMTVHGSKGLQAPIVILPDTTQPPNAPGSQPLWPVELAHSGAPLFAGSTDDYAGAAQERYDQIKVRQNEEYNRLLYVAMTRAADWLLVCGWQHGNGKNLPEKSWYERIKAGFEALAETDQVTKTGEGDSAIWEFASVQSAAPKPDARPFDDGDPLDALPDWATRLAAMEQVRELALTPSGGGEDETHAQPAAASPIGADDSVNAALARGRLVHTLLQWLPAAPIAVRAKRLTEYLAKPVHDLDAAAQAALTGEVLAILDHPDYAPLFGPDSRAEVSVTGEIVQADGTRVSVNGQIDRLVVLSDRGLIVDYKTNRPPPTTIEAVPPAYLRQLAMYRLLVQRLYPEKPVETALLWTIDSRIMAIPAPVLDQYSVF